MKHAKRLLALALAALLMMSLLPTAAFAAGESGIQLGTGGLGTDDAVYFGAYNGETVPWVVLNANALSGTTVASGANVLPLLSQYLLGQAKFENGLMTYGASKLKPAMDAIYAGFDAGEQGALADTTLTGNSMHSGILDLAGQKLFPLSKDEAATGSGKYFADNTARIAYELANKSTAADWWLRSTIYSDSSKSNRACYLDYQGDIYDAHGQDYWLRPACNLDLTKVLFTSAAAGGKASGPVGAGALHSNLTPSGATGWKLTLLDSGRNGFAASLSSGSSAMVAAGGSVAIDYSGAKTGPNEYVSALLVNGSGSVLYYGRIVHNSASGTAQAVAIPAGLAAGTYTLKIFNEQFNGDHTGGAASNAKTDYASGFRDIRLTVSGGGAAGGAEADIPQTGDGNLPGLWLGLLALAIAGLAADRRLRKQKRGK